MFQRKKQSEQPSHPSLELLAQHVACAERLSHQQREFVTDHLAQCPYCCNLYSVLCDIDGELWEEACKAADIPKRVPVFTRSLEEAFADLWQRIEAEEATLHRQRRRTLAFRIGSIAAAACLLIAIGVGWVMRYESNSGQPVQNGIADSGELPAALAELVTDQGRKPLVLNQAITTRNQPQEILLGGMHRVVMNTNTSMVLAAESVVIDTERRVRYEIQLPQGEVYVEVVPGHPFAVKTNNALLAITGTKFNVRAMPGRTDLTLLKGSVRFSTRRAQDKYVHVPAGRSSSILAQSAPSPPKQTDASAATAWARDFVMRNTLAHVQPGLDEEFLESIRNGWMQAEPPDLDKLDYEQWRDEHRDWFKKQFPWIFEIPEFLQDQYDIKADYIDLLMISGDIWQFNYPRQQGKSIPIRTATAIKRLAEHYGVALESFKDIIERNDLLLNGPAEVYRDSLIKWQTAITNANQSELSDELLLFSLRAGQYLANTRTAAYLWIKQNPQKAESIFADKNYRSLFLPEEVTDKIRSADTFQDYFREQLSLVAEISHNSQELFITPKSSGCQENTAMTARQLQERLSEFIHGGLEK